MQPSDDVTRRRLLVTSAAAGAVSLSGCLGIWDQPGASDVKVYNRATNTKIVSVTITDSGEETVHTARTLELDPGETVDPVNEGKLPLNTAYTVEVEVEGGPSETFEWDDPDVGLAPLWVVVDGSRNIRFLLEAG